MPSPVASGSQARFSKRLFLTLLGKFELTRANGEVVNLSGKREKILFSYLALAPGQSERRRKLATILWGDASDETLLDNLRTCVWALRKALGDSSHDLIVSQDDSIALAPDAVSVDVLEFQSLAAHADRRHLEAAAALHDGEILEGSEISGIEFEQWLAEQRTRVRDAAIDLYLRLGAVLADAGEPSGAIRSLQKLLQLDPYHEGGVRRLMTLYVEAGRRGAAFETYRSLAESLYSDLGAEPESETRRVFARISQGDYEKTETEASKKSEETTNQAVAASFSEPPAGAGGAKKRASRSLVAGAALVLILAIAGLSFYGLPKSEPEGEPMAAQQFPPLPERPSIAVLSFENLGDDAAEDSFADALTNDITTALSIISNMFVIDRYSTLAYQDRSISIQQIAQELGVRYIVEGSVQRTVGRVRISARLIDSLTGQQIWANRYDRQDQDTFALQDEITLAVITALEVQLTEGEQRRYQLVHGTQNLEAWVTSGQALQQLRSLTSEDNLLARELYERAIELDPNFAAALDGLAWTYLFAARFGWSDNPERDLGAAQELAARAMEIDPFYSRNHTLRGMLELTASRHDAAIRSGERAVELDPNGSENLALLGLILTYAGDADRARDFLLRAMRLSPYYPDWYRYALGRALRMNGELAEAEDVLTSFDSAGALRVMTLAELAQLYIALGRPSEAQAVAERIREVFPSFSVGSWVANPPYASAALMEAEASLLRGAGLPDG